MAKRNPNSTNQRIMSLFFGDDANKYPSEWKKWPEPQRSIYSRMLSNSLTIVTLASIDALKLATLELSKFDSRPNGRKNK